MYKKELKEFISTGIVHSILSRLWTTFADKDEQGQLHINDGPDCYTDLKDINLGMLPFFVEDKFSDDVFGDRIRQIIRRKGLRGLWILVFKAELAHEMQHINSTTNKAMVHTRETISKILSDIGIHEAIGLQFAANLFNIVEDGRIEAIVSGKFPGMKIPFLLLNSQIRYSAKIEKIPENPQEEYQTLIGLILSYAKTGMLPEGWKKIEDERVYAEYKKIENLIDRGIEAKTCMDCSHITIKIAEKIKEYIRELLEQDSMLANIMEQIMDNSTYNNEEIDSNDEGQSSLRKISSKSKDSKAQDEDSSSKKKDSSDNDETEEEKNNPEGSNEDKNNPKDLDEEKGKDRNKKSSSSSEKENSSEEQNSGEKEDGENSSSSPDGSKEHNSSKENSGDEGSETSDSKKKNSDNKKNDTQSESSNSKSGEDLSTHKETKLSDKVSDEIANESKDRNSYESSSDGYSKYEEDVENEGWSDEEIDKLEDLIEKAEKEIKSKELVIDRNRKLTQGNLKKSDVAEIQNSYVDDDYTSFKEIPYDLKPVDTPYDVKKIGSSFRRDIEKILFVKNKARRNLRQGSLDPSSIWKVGVRSGKVFKRNNQKGKDFAFYILQDGSGSMMGQKEIESAKTMAILEEGLKDFSALKITTFNVRSDVTHHTAKQFNDNRNFNHAYSFLKNKRADGGNKDGYSIRVATRELEKRKEQKKVLLVLSDGLPSHYKYGRDQALNDVRTAVEEARKKGIRVISILFGDDDFIQGSEENYLYMYKYNILKCNPKNIGRKILPIFKQIMNQ